MTKHIFGALTIIGLAGALAGCVSPSTQLFTKTGVYKFDQVITPTRIGVKDEEDKFFTLDLANLTPVSQSCSGRPDVRCAWLSEHLEGKYVSVKYEYKRFGLPLYTVYDLDPKTFNYTNGKLPVNLGIVMDGVVTRSQIDNWMLPKDLAKALALIKSLRVNQVVVAKRKAKLKPWELRSLNKETSDDSQQ